MQHSRDPILISHDRDMERFARAVSGVSVVGVDTESDSFYAYREKICLIQVSTEHEDFLIDPLSVRDLSVFQELLQNPEVVKIFHAAENDVILLRHHLGATVRNLFDTLVAAQVVGIETCSLAGLLHVFFGIELSKKEQRSDWRRRPLTESQILYAALDTRYLMRLRQELVARMTELDRMEEAEWDFRSLEDKVWSPKPFRPEDFIRIKGARDLEGVELRVLRELFVLRNEMAREADVAPFRILGDATLLALTRARPKNPSEAQGVPSFPRRQRKLLTRVLEAIRTAERQGPMEPPVFERGPTRPRLTPEEVRLYDGLRRWRERRAKQRGVLTYRIARNDALSAIVRAHPSTLEDLEGVEALDAWRTKTYGPEILEELHRLESAEGA